MISNYPAEPLSRFATIYSGYAFKSKDLVKEGGIPILKIANIQDRAVLRECATCLPESLYKAKFQKYVLQQDDILIAMTGAGSVGRVGKMRIVRGRYLVNQRVGIIRVDPKLADPEYVYQIISSAYFENVCYNLALGAGQPNLSPTMIGSVEIPAPPLPTQRKIAAILSASDDLIENNIRRIAILEEVARLLYREWFVHFRFPGHEQVAMMDSELGLIPEGWEVGKLGSIVKNIRNTTRAGDHLQSRKYVPIDCISKKTLTLSEHKSWEEAQSSLILFEKGDILFGAMRPYFHKVAMAPFAGVTRTTCFVLRPKEESLFGYATYLLFQDETVAYANAHSKGATIPYATWEGSMSEMAALIPSHSLVDRFKKSASPMLQLAAGLAARNAVLRRTRDLLLPRLISGEVDVSGLDIKIGGLNGD